MKNRIFFLLIVLGAVLLLNSSTCTEDANEVVVKSVDLTKVEDGTYSGKCIFFKSKAWVKVTVKNSKIENVELVKMKGKRADKVKDLPQNIVKYQTVLVDAISGASFGSKAVKKAAERALKKGIK